MATAHGDSTDEVLSAQGTKLNKRGIESRRRFIAQAIETLSAGGPSAASANLVAKRAGFTWGTVQHQFGDADGVWAAVIERMDASLEGVELRADASWSVRRRVSTLIDQMWAGWERPEARAVESLRLALPRSPEQLAAEFPKTEVALREFDAHWERLWSQAFADLPITATELRRVRTLIPAALRGLRHDVDVVGYADPEEGRKVLIDAVVAYLEAGASRPE